MSLLRDIQNAAASPDIRTSDLLRKCKILAARLKSKELARWVDWELNGYGDDDRLPDYRIIPRLGARGHFIGAFGHQLRNAQIPTVSVPEYVENWVKDIPLRRGIAVYEDLVYSDPDSIPRMNWPIEVIGLYQHEYGPFYEGLSCAQAWTDLPRGVFLRLLDTARNKVLGFALDIEVENPEAGEAEVNTVPVPPTVVQHVFNNHFYSSVGNVAAGSHDFNQMAEGL